MRQPPPPPKKPRKQQVSHIISEVQKLGFKYCRRSHKAHSLVSSELGETGMSLAPNPKVNHPKSFTDVKQSAETPASRRSLPGPPSDPQKAGRQQGGKCSVVLQMRNKTMKWLAQYIGEIGTEFRPHKLSSKIIGTKLALSARGKVTQKSQC